MITLFQVLVFNEQSGVPSKYLIYLSMKISLLIIGTLFLFSCRNNNSNEEDMAEFEREVERALAEVEFNSETTTENIVDNEYSEYEVLTKNSKHMLDLDYDYHYQLGCENCTLKITKKGYLMSTGKRDTAYLFVHEVFTDYNGNFSSEPRDTVIYLLK